MKKFSLIPVLVFLFQLTAISQTCLPGGITFSNQIQIDNFQTNYPNCTEIEGGVEITGGYIANLNGLNVLTSIGGGLHVSDNQSLINLTGLENITTIGGDVEIGWMFFLGPVGNPFLTSLTGLDNLTSIGGNLQIIGNENLLSLAGLENLTFVGGNLIIGHGWTGWATGGNPSLESITGLANVTFIGGNIGIYDNETLISLIGLEGLTSIGGHLNIGIGGGSGNASLTNLTGLDNVTSIGGDLDISENTALTDLSSLDNLTSIGGSLVIGKNDTLTSLTGLDNINPVSISDLQITDNEALSTCEILSVCSYLSSPNGNINIQNNATGCNSQQEVEDICFICLPEGITISTQEQIDSFHVNYPNCSRIQGDVTISGDDIINLNGLINVTSIAGSLYIEDNPAIVNLWGLVNIDPLTLEDLHIVNNTSLSVCDIQNFCEYLANPNGTVNIQNNASGCNSQEEVEENCYHHCLPEGVSLTTQAEIDSFYVNYPNCAVIEGDLWIHGENISNLNGLNDLTSIGEDLIIDDNEVLTSLTGLEGLNYIGGNLTIGSYPGGNPALSSLAGLMDLTLIGGDIFIYANSALTSLSGLENINNASIKNLSIKYNSLLSTCHIQSICDYLASPNGTVVINNNAPGCNSLEEVELACDAVTFEEIIIKSGFSISPNPCSGLMNLRFAIYETGFTNLNLFEISGVNIKTLLKEKKGPGTYEMKVDLSDIPAGIYFCVLKTNEKIYTRKIIKL